MALVIVLIFNSIFLFVTSNRSNRLIDEVFLPQKTAFIVTKLKNTIFGSRDVFKHILTVLN